MDTGLFIALLNPAITLVLAAAFLTLWLYQRHRPYLAVLSAGYACSAAGFLLQYIAPPEESVTRLLSNVAFTIAVCCVAGAVVGRYGGRRVPFMAISILAAGGLAVYSWFLFVQSDLTWRILSVNFAFGAISFVVAAELRMVRRRGPTEAIIFVLSLLAGTNFVVRTLIAVTMHGPFANYDGFYTSVYWTTALLSHALLSLLLALCLLTAAVLDVMAVLRNDSHTDALSGLFNRRGFEARASQLLERCASGGVPIALVLADLDHFKSINDRYGHAAGDRVIACFAGKLSSAAGVRGIAGRIGGEEFAVLLPLADLAAARLFAEAVRTLFSSDAVDGLPRGTRVTASFGIAARTGAEALGPLMRRADDALYKAKQNGRDSVRLSYERPAERPATFLPEAAERV